MPDEQAPAAVPDAVGPTPAHVPSHLPGPPHPPSPGHTTGTADISSVPTPSTPAAATDPGDTAPPAIPPVPAAEPEPGRWGWVDDDGTVWLRAEATVDREAAKQIGSWQAGDADEGLAHFARRFDDLRTEGELLVARLGAGRGDARSVLRSAVALRERVVDASVVGDLVGLTARLDAVMALAERATEQEKAEKAGAREEAVARKEALITEAETLAEETTRWKHAGDRFSAMLDDWKAIRGIDRKTDDALWKRFSRARETFTRRRGAHFADLDRARSAAKTRKEGLVVEAEGLTDSTDWGPTAGRYKELMAEWKAAGRTSKDADDALWARFRGAQDMFFTRRSEAFSARDAEFEDNARAKEELLTEAARIDLDDVEAARATLRDVQERWDRIGKVPRDRVKEFSARLKEVEDRVRGAVDRRWQANPETEARVGQFRARVEQYEAAAAKARAAGDRRRAEEAERQAAQWREWLNTAEQARS